jgi:4-hydroxy-3-methylbut-2-enyl diphosphate reductase
VNRTLRVERWPVHGIRPGEIMVATGMAHPERGAVRCPAAPLLAAALRREAPYPGWRRVRPGLVSVATGADAVLVMASYLDRTGRATGLGAAARADDPAAVAACGELVAAWAAVLRSRRLLVAGTNPDCAGSLAATEAMLRAARDAPAGTPVHVLGQPVAAAGRLARLAAAGVVVTTELDEIPDKAIVVFPAHGVPERARAEAAARGLPVVDATCPLAAMAHRDVRAYADRADTVVLVTGSRQTAGERVSVAQAPESVLLVRDAADVPGPRHAGIDPDRLSLVVQTGIPVEDAAATISVLRARFPRVRGQHDDALCYAATDRSTTVRSVAASSDLTLVLGTAEDPDTQHMHTEAAAVCPLARRVATVTDLEAGWLADATTIGVVLTRSARPGLLAHVRTALSGLGPLSAVTRRVQTVADPPRPAPGVIGQPSVSSLGSTPRIPR